MDSVLKQLPSFGGLLRALRLGYRWEERYGCFIRLSTPWTEPDALCLEVAPASGPPPSVKGFHRCYWETPDKGASLLAMIQPLQELGPVTCYQSIYLNEEGGAAPQTS